jgi:hypothetical protein
MIEIAPRELWKYNLTADESRLYIFTIPGYRIATEHELYNISEEVRKLDNTMRDAWCQEDLNNPSFEGETGTAIPVRDIK